MASSPVEIQDPFQTLTVLCREPSWNATRVWASEVPEMDACMERTALLWAPSLLLWAPSLLLWAFGLPLLVQLRRRPFGPTSWTLLLSCKVFFTAILLASTATQLGWAAVAGEERIPSAELIAGAVLLATYSLHMMLILVGRRKGVRSSGVIWVYWLFSLVCSLPQLYAFFGGLNGRIHGVPRTVAATFVIQFLCHVALFLVSCFSDSRFAKEKGDTSEKPSPLLQASLPSRLFFWWTLPLVWRGWRRPLTLDDLWDIEPHNSCSTLAVQWDNAITRDNGSSSPACKTRRKARYERVMTPGSKVSILLCMWRLARGAFLASLLFHSLSEGLQFLTPRILSRIIKFMADGDEPEWHGYFYAVSLFLSCGVGSLLRNVFSFKIYCLSTRIRSVIMTAVYRKALSLSGTARRDSSVGEIVNLMAVDAQIIGRIFSVICYLVTLPVTIIVSIIFLWQELGASVLAGVAVLVLLVPLTSFLANRVKDLQQTNMKFGDRRVKMMNEIISGIKVLKLYAWEGAFSSMVDKIRKKEINLLQKVAFYRALNSFLSGTSPYTIALATFTTYLLVSPENILDVEKAFVSISLFNIMRIPICKLPIIISDIIQATVALKRVQKFTNAEELDPRTVCRDHSEVHAIAIRGGKFTWAGDEDQATWELKDINLEVGHGKTVAVVGSVGAGKSSLISALLGEMRKVEGKVVVNGRVAYVSQQAWLQNATLRDNIIWGQPFDEKRYRQVVAACALQQDLDMFPGGDMTEIGEKGINLSGGQKQRVSLARAVYSAADVFLLDDPLSAVDAHVGRFIFDNVIGPQGILKDKTRLLVTHAVTFLPRVDEVIVIKDGQMLEKGTYTNLIAKQGDFASYVLRHQTESAEEKSEKDLKLSRPDPFLTQVSSESSESSVNTNRDLPLLTMKVNNDEKEETEKLRSKEEVCSKTIKGQKLVQEEISETGKISRHVYLIYGKSIGLVYAVVPLVFITLGQTSNVSSNVWLSKYAFTSANDSGGANVTSSSFAVTREVFLLGYGAFGVAQALFLFLGMLSLMQGCLRASRALHQRLLQSVVRLPMSFFDTNPSGRIINRFSKEVSVLDIILPDVVCASFDRFVQVIIKLIMIIAAIPAAGVFMVPIMALNYIVQSFYIASSRQLKRIASVSRSPVYSHFSETLQGVSIIRAFKKQQEFYEESLRKIDLSLKAVYANAAINRWVTVSLETVGHLITFTTAMVGVVGREYVGASLLGLALSYALNLIGDLEMLMRVSAEMEANIVSVERINDYLVREQEASWTTSDTPTAWPEEGRISFRNFQTRYRAGLELVLKGITCSFKPAEKVGIVGRTGAGKSSLTLALFRLTEGVGGEIDIDKVNIANVGLHDLRGRISIIPQDPVLFSGTVRLNLDPLGVCSDGDIWKALELAHLAAHIRSQPMELQHVVDEGGANFSIGQRQLVCLARALLRKSRVLVLDEATAAVDLETDDLIQATIRSQFAHCTVLTIAHRLNTIMDSDRVLVLDHGRIAEFAPPAVLLADPDSVFYGMAKDAGLV
ncbi:canalicular multispecific organic anion transporter 2-like [Penaeus monodon]|uniref:canalicular multispecific organic anion transporter 2-like n=1 Tax=Penaeus monodon TaxID=6687 RepID=UPI0018A7148B|nr:canalicular multispecific organic anion transporter 2-like [Penaeus monodon]